MLTSNGRWTAIAAVVVALFGWIFQYRNLLVIAAMLLVALVAGVIWTLRRPTLSAFQHLVPGVVGAGEVAHANVTTTNTGSRPSAPVIASDVIGGKRVAIDIPRLAPQESHVASLLLPTDQRGHFEVGPLVIERSDPFGLFRTTTHRGASSTLVVHPAIHPMSALPTGHRRELEGSASARPQEGGISFHSLRDYVAGDDLRLVHWRSVARTGNLMVRKNIITSEPRLMVVLDTWSGSYTPESFEDAVRVAASLVAAGCESRYPVMFRTTGGEEADAAPTGEGRSDIMRILAGVQPSDDDPGLNGVVRVAERVEGISLGAVTGQPPPERTVGVSRVRPRFDMVTVVQVGETFDRPPMSIAGAVVVNGADSEQVATRWKGRFG